MPPVETLSFDVELDATDQLKNPAQDKKATGMSIYPQSAALEMIMHPKNSLVISNISLAALGT